PGFGDRASMLATYEAALGRPVAPLRWFEVFAMLRSGSMMVRIARLLAARGVDDSWLTRGNPTAGPPDRLLAARERSVSREAHGVVGPHHDRLQVADPDAAAHR